MRTIEKALKELEDGKLVIYPTETCYGLGADATNFQAIKKVFETKQREKTKPISVLFSNLKMAEQYCKITGKIKKVAGLKPLTIITHNKSLPDFLCGKKIGFRIPGHPIAKQLVSKFGKPITATSANKSGSAPIYKFKKVVSVFPNTVSIDGGNLPNKNPSTVWDATEEKILRKGPVREEEIQALLE